MGLSWTFWDLYNFYTRSDRVWWSFTGLGQVCQGVPNRPRSYLVNTCPILYSCCNLSAPNTVTIMSRSAFRLNESWEIGRKKKTRCTCYRKSPRLACWCTAYDNPKQLSFFPQKVRFPISDLWFLHVFFNVFLWHRLKAGPSKIASDNTELHGLLRDLRLGGGYRLLESTSFKDDIWTHGSHRWCHFPWA